MALVLYDPIEVQRAIAADRWQRVRLGDLVSGQPAAWCAACDKEATLVRSDRDDLRGVTLAMVECHGACEVVEVMDVEARAEEGGLGLVVDDLGAERHGVEVVFKDLASKLISTRFQRGSKPPLPTIVTTGLTPEAAERLYGGGVARRIFNDDGGQVRVVQFAPKKPKQARSAA